MAETGKEGTEAEGLAKSVAGILGISDVIVGGLFLYAAFGFGGPSNAVFHTTTIKFVDVALLACAAALIGKVMSLLVAVPMALLRRRLREGDRGKGLRSLLNEHATKQRVYVSNGDPYEIALMVIALNSPVHFQYIDNIRSSSVLAYASGFDAIVFACVVGTTHAAVMLAFGGLSAFLMILGIVLQYSHASSIAHAVFAILNSPPPTGAHKSDEPTS